MIGDEGEDVEMKVIYTSESSMSSFDYQLPLGIPPGRSYFFLAVSVPPVSRTYSLYTPQPQKARTDTFVINDYAFNLGCVWTHVGTDINFVHLKREPVEHIIDQPLQAISSVLGQPYLMRQGLNHKGVCYYEGDSF
jgi:hypothetical protein